MRCSTTTAVKRKRKKEEKEKKKKKIARICVQHKKGVFRVELDEIQCLYTATGNFVCVLVVTHCRVDMCYLSLLLPVQEKLYLLPFVFGFWKMISAGSGRTALLCGFKYFTCLSSAGVTLY